MRHRNSPTASADNHARYYFTIPHVHSNVLGAMLRTAQRAQRDGQYETRTHPTPADQAITARQRRSLQLLYNLGRCGLSSTANDSD